MKVQIIFEPHDAIPPKVFDGFNRALVALKEQHGLVGPVSVDQTSAMDCYARWFAWLESQNGGE